MFCINLSLKQFSFQKAISVANKAFQEDEEGNYEEAIKSYQHAVRYLLHVVKRKSGFNCHVFSPLDMWTCIFIFNMSLSLTLSYCLSDSLIVCVCFSFFR